MQDTGRDTGLPTQALQAVQAHEMRGQGISQHTNNHTHTAVTPLQ